MCTSELTIALGRFIIVINFTVITVTQVVIGLRDISTAAIYFYYVYLSTEKPDSPRNLRAIETCPDSIVIQWDPPQNDGGSPLVGYVIEKRDAKRNDYIYIADVEASVTQYVYNIISLLCL